MVFVHVKVQSNRVRDFSAKACTCSSVEYTTTLACLVKTALNVERLFDKLLVTLVLFE